MKIHLITGATGFVGKYLAKALLEKGENVWIIVRPLSKASARQRAEEIFHDYSLKWPEAFRVLKGDVLIENLGIARSTTKELQNHEVVFWHLAANLSFASKNRADVQKTNYIGTVNVIHFANKVARSFMHMSTAYVCGNSLSFKESDLDKGQTFRNHYEKSKFEAEKYVRDNCKPPHIIFRPSVIIGDAYLGKAEGCTFGYYRYAFMFHFLKKQITTSLHGSGFIAYFLKTLGTRYSQRNDILHVPWFLLPYPKNCRVDLVTVDYVIESMISLYKKDLQNITAHLTHNNPPAFDFVLRAVLYDLGFRGTKLFPVPIWTFNTIFKCLYFFVVSIRTYVTSIMWYVPYFTKVYEFERATVDNHLRNPPKISRELVRRINIYAKENILDHIKV